jgi:hypothetical protein
MTPSLRALTWAALALGGCQSDGATPAPYADGLSWATTSQITRTTRQFYQVQGEAAVESKGLIGTTARCSDATASAGTLTTTEVVEAVTERFVIGNTVTHHPIEPGADTFNGLGVSIIQEQTTETGRTSARETTFVPDGDPETREDASAGPLVPNTVARTYGVAADEYLVELTPLDLWADDGGSDEPGTSAGDGVTRDWSLLTRHAPRRGDVWTSLSGDVVFHYDGPTRADVGGDKVGGDLISSYAVVNVDGLASDVLATCVRTAPVSTTSTLEGAVNLTTEQADLDSGCVDRFEHARIGTEIWARDTLAQFSGRRVFVQIDDFGWEWFDDVGDTCIRSTSTQRPTDAPDARLFVSFQVIDEITLSANDGWSVVDDAPPVP